MKRPGYLCLDTQLRRGKSQGGCMVALSSKVISQASQCIRSLTLHLADSSVTGASYPTQGKKKFYVHIIIIFKHNYHLSLGRLRNCRCRSILYWKILLPTEMATMKISASFCPLDGRPFRSMH